MPIGAAFVLASTAALAGAQGAVVDAPRTDASATPEAPAQGSAAPMADTAEGSGALNDRVRDAWMLSVEGVARAPIDLGFQAGVEMPFGLRLFGGYGWVPSSYLDFLAGLAAGSRAEVRTVLREAHYGGDSARFVAGFRPFHQIGLYLDLSYAHVRLDATQPIPSFSVPGYSFPGGTYRLHTGIDIWAAELGYEGEIAERLVLGGALGVTGSFGSSTTIVPVGAAPNETTALSEASNDIDHVIRTHVLPTLTLRLGFDLI